MKAVIEPREGVIVGWTAKGGKVEELRCVGMGGPGVLPCFAK